ncbi:MAG: patatin-like phospholipase family protein, partial [Spirochaetales bacterium]|nr:patatin-like phospholipase family protein [Spirochaetales bacterium]
MIAGERARDDGAEQAMRRLATAHFFLYTSGEQRVDLAFVAIGGIRIDGIRIEMEYYTYMEKKASILVVMVLFLSFFSMMSGVAAFAQETPENDGLVLMDVPVFYGEEHLLARLEHLPSGRSKPVGLLLSGGSARAFAHIGVLKRLEETGYAPDFIVTNSMGSIVGLLYGAGLSPDDIMNLINKIEMSRLFEPELPLKGGILNASTFIELMEELIPYDDIRNLPIPVIVVCEDLRSKRKIILAEGDFSKVLAASFALPVYFRPQEMYGHLLIDGGVSNLVPVSIPYRYTDRVMVSTTFYQKELNLNNPLTILNVAMDISKSRSGITDLKTFDPLWIRCDVETFSFMDWGAMEEIAGHGYRSASLALSGNSRLRRFEQRDASYLEETHAKALGAAESGLREYMLNGLVSTEPVLSGAKLGIELEKDLYGRRYFGDRNRFSGGAYLRLGYGLLDGRAFYQPRWLNQYQYPGESYAGTSLRVELNPAGRFRFSGSTDLNFAEDPVHPSEWSFHSTCSDAGLSIPFRLGNKVRVEPLVRGEYKTDGDLKNNGALVLGGMKLSPILQNSRFSTELETAFFYDDTGRTAFEGELLTQIPVTASLTFAQRVMTRLPILESGDVPYFPADYYRTITEPEILKNLAVSNSSLIF